MRYKLHYTYWTPCDRGYWYHSTTHIDKIRHDIDGNVVTYYTPLLWYRKERGRLRHYRMTHGKHGQKRPR